MRPPRIQPLRPLQARCLLEQLFTPCYRTSHSAAKAPRQPRWQSSAAAGAVLPARGLPLATQTGFFLSNRIFERSNCLTSVITTSRELRSSSTSTATFTSNPHSSSSEAPQSVSELAPHRRRQVLKRQQAASSNGIPATDAPLPPDASSILSNVAAAQPTSLRRTASALLSLSKPRLSALMVLTAMASYAVYPVPEMLTPSMTETPSLSPLTLLFLTSGTALCSASANALNMLYELSTDAKMSRTRNRPLVRNLISNRTAVLFAVVAGATGVCALYFGVNPTVSALGFANIALYAGAYTPLKRVTAFNTWIGAVVGGIPPLMGWAAAAGEAATRDGSWRELLLASDGSSIGGWLMAGILFAWQFPHFMALSWTIREEYKAAGLRMLAWTNPARNSRVALRYSLAFVPLCLALCAAGVTNWGFAATSLPINLWLCREAVRFWRKEGQAGSARGLFWASIWYLPGILILVMLHKKDMWTRAWKSVFGVADDGEWEDDEFEEMVSLTADKVAEKAASTKNDR